LTRFTFEGDSGDPCWTPDGKSVVFGSFRNGEYGLYLKSVDGSAPEEKLVSRKEYMFPTSISPDGKELAFFDLSGGPSHIWIVPLEGERKPREYLAASYNTMMPAFSPDGHWLAYESDESGRSEIFVQQYPGPGGKLQISNQGGGVPVWSRDGHQLFYRNEDKLMAVSIQTKPAFSAGAPRQLFQGDYFVSFHYYDVMPDGKQFVFIKESEQGRSAPQINVVLNWFEELKQKVGPGRR
jgi:Tol biopolymer transport system component